MSTSVQLATQQSDGQKVEIKTILKHDLLNGLQQQQFNINSNSTLQQQTQRWRRRQRISRWKENDILVKEWEALHMLEENCSVVDLIDVFESNYKIGRRKRIFEGFRIITNFYYFCFIVDSSKKIISTASVATPVLGYLLPLLFYSYLQLLYNTYKCKTC